MEKILMRAQNKKKVKVKAKMTSLKAKRNETSKVLVIESPNLFLHIMPKESIDIKIYEKM